MTQIAKIMQNTLAVAEKLPLSARRQLAEKLLQQSSPNPYIIVIPFEQFDPTVVERLQYLMDRNNEGTISRGERRELAALVREDERMMLVNSQALLRMSRPDLFDERGHLVSARLDKAVREKARSVGTARRSRKPAWTSKAK